MYQAHFRMYYAYMNYADPHPGNYLFLDDGRLGLIDFGCVQYYGPEEREILRLCERLIDEDDVGDPGASQGSCPGLSRERSGERSLSPDDGGIEELDDGADPCEGGLRLRK